MLTGSSGSPPALNGGSIEVQGDLQVMSGYSGYTGNTAILLNGTNNQTITSGTSASYPSISVSTGGSLTINNGSPLTLQNLTATSVSFIGTGALTLPATIYPGTLTQNTAAGMTFGGGTVNGSVYISSGTAYITGNTTITGSMTIAAGAVLNENTYTVSVVGSSTNNGTINP
jgi:hypothetical protein